MDLDFKSKVEAHFVKGAQEHAQELNIMYIQADKQRAALEKQAMQGPNISVEEIVVDPVDVTVIKGNDAKKEQKEEDFVL